MFFCKFALEVNGKTESMTKNKKTSFSDLLKAQQENEHKKLSAKLPSWTECESLSLPPSTSLEQCSSGPMAEYKAHFLERTLPSHGVIADLTGGFGSDSWAFSKVFDKILYFERNEALCQLARKNFAALCEHHKKELNIECTSLEVDAETIEKLGTLDCIYADPARRDSKGKKVFLIEDCAPDMTDLLPAISKVSHYLLIKYSPMADITMLRRRLSILPDFTVKSIGVIGLNSEVKEILVFLSDKHVDVPELFIADAVTGQDEMLNLDGIPREIKLMGRDKPSTGEFLLEPNAILLKSGYHDSICTLFDAEKIGQDCHLYVTSERADDKHELAKYVKQFEIVKCMEFNKKNIREIGALYPKAEVKAKGIHLKSEELAALLGCKSGIAEDGEHYQIFAVANGRAKHLLATRII